MIEDDYAFNDDGDNNDEKGTSSGLKITGF